MSDPTPIAADARSVVTISGGCEVCAHYRRPNQFHARVACPYQQPPTLIVDWNAVGRLSAHHDHQHACHAGLQRLDAMPSVGQVVLLTDGEMVCFGRVVAVGEGDYADWFYVDEASDLTHLEEAPSD